MLRLLFILCVLKITHSSAFFFKSQRYCLWKLLNFCFVCFWTFLSAGRANKVHFIMFSLTLNTNEILSEQALTSNWERLFLNFYFCFTINYQISSMYCYMISSLLYILIFFIWLVLVGVECMRHPDVLQRVCQAN